MRAITLTALLLGIAALARWAGQAPQTEPPGAKKALAQVDQAVDHFLASSSDTSRRVKKERLAHMLQQLEEAFAEPKYDAQVQAALSKRAARIESPEMRALLFYFVSEALRNAKREALAIQYLDKAIALKTSRENFYRQARKSLETKAPQTAPEEKAP